MSEEFKHEVPVAPEGETDVVALIKKMQQQLTALDKKIEILMSRPKESSFGRKSFSRPSGSFNRPSFHGRDDRRPSDRGEYRHGGRESFGGRDSFRPREAREGNFRERDSREGRSFEKKPYSGERSHSSSERPHSGEPRAFAPRKKPFFLKRKERE
ncbi:MAG: hypothetical protein WCX16_05445 [Candidatus Omnitrophota bacterium]|jgi:hypothetical protein